MKPRPLWRCSKCGRPFANRNQVHLCGLRTVREHLAGKRREVVALYRRFVGVVRRCGPVKLLPQKTRIAVQARTSFAYVRLLRDALAVGLVLARRLASPRILKIESGSEHSHLHHLRIRGPEELDREIGAWLREAYRLSQQLPFKQPESPELLGDVESTAVEALPARRPKLKPRPLWRCPKCRKYYVTRNMWHACARHTEEEHLEGKSPHVVWLYRRLVKMLEQCGPVRVVPGKTGITFQARMRFAGARLGKSSVRVGFVLTRRVESPRITSIVSYSPRSHGHHLEIRSLDDLDVELQGWLCEAYRVGQQLHLCGAIE